MPLPNDPTVKREVKPHVPVPEDTYNVQIWDLELVAGDKEAKLAWQKEDRMKIIFVVLDKEFRGRILSKPASFSFSTGGKKFQPSTLYNLACAVAGEKLDDREPFKPNSLIGKVCRIVVKHREPAEDGSIWEVISDFIGLKKGETFIAMTLEELEAIQKEAKEKAKDETVSSPKVEESLTEKSKKDIDNIASKAVKTEKKK